MGRETLQDRALWTTSTLELSELYFKAKKRKDDGETIQKTIFNRGICPIEIFIDAIKNGPSGFKEIIFNNTKFLNFACSDEGQNAIASYFWTYAYACSPLAVVNTVLEKDRYDQFSLSDVERLIENKHFRCSIETELVNKIITNVQTKMTRWVNNQFYGVSKLVQFLEYSYTQEQAKHLNVKQLCNSLLSLLVARVNKLQEVYKMPEPAVTDQPTEEPINESVVQ